MLFMAAGGLLNLTPGPGGRYVVGGALLMASSTAFTVLKWLGAAYLLVGGVHLLFSKAPPAINLEAAQAYFTRATGLNGLKNVFFKGFWTHVLNPKVALSFLAFVPQLISTGAENPALQFLLLGWASRRTAVMQKGLPWLERFVGAMFIGFGIKLALTAAPKA